MRIEASSPPVPEPRPARGRKEATQDRIVDAARRLFTARGYDRTSIAAIAGDASVSTSTVFWHFGDKESLFRETLRRMILPLFEEVQAGLRHVPAEERIAAIFASYERVVEENAEAIRSFVRWLLGSETVRRQLLDALFSLHDTLIRHVEETFVELAVEPAEARTLAAAVVAMLDGNFLLTLLDGRADREAIRRAGARRLTERALRRCVDG